LIVGEAAGATVGVRIDGVAVVDLQAQMLLTDSFATSQTFGEMRFCSALSIRDLHETARPSMGTTASSLTFSQISNSHLFEYVGDVVMVGYAEEVGGKVFTGEGRGEADSSWHPHTF